MKGKHWQGCHHGKRGSQWHGARKLSAIVVAVAISTFHATASGVSTASADRRATEHRLIGPGDRSATAARSWRSEVMAHLDRIYGPRQTDEWPLEHDGFVYTLRLQGLWMRRSASARELWVAVGGTRDKPDSRLDAGLMQLFVLRTEPDGRIVERGRSERMTVGHLGEPPEVLGLLQTGDDRYAFVLRVSEHGMGARHDLYELLAPQGSEFETIGRILHLAELCTVPGEPCRRETLALAARSPAQAPAACWSLTLRATRHPPAHGKTVRQQVLACDANHRYGEFRWTEEDR